MDLPTLLGAVDTARDEIVRLLQDLVRIPTVNVGPRPDTGHETAACELLRDTLAQAGIVARVYESAPGRGNLLARIGQAGGKRLLLMAHTDVVPVEDETLWEHPPFSGTLDRGRVYGRGADDDKADVAAYAMAMVLLERLGAPLDGELVYLAAADEESGGQWGAGWVAERFPEAVRADYAVNEGGGSPIRTPNGMLYPVATGEKSRLEARVTRQGRSGHASRPWAADNPLPVVADVIRRIAAYEPEIDVSHPFFRSVLSALGVPQMPTAENIDRIAERLRGDYPALASTLKAASRMTVTPTMLSAGVKSNSIPDRAQLVCDVRGLPGQDDAFVRQELSHLLDGLDVSIDVDYTAVSNASPGDSPFVNALRQALAAGLADDTVRVVPSLTVGFTDSRFIRPLGTQVYGFSPYDPSADPTRTGVHGNNEYMEVESLVLRTKCAVALAWLTLGPGRPQAE